MNVQKAQTQFDFFSLMDIRCRVFMGEQNVDPLIEIDNEDKTCDHFILKDNNVIIGTCRILKNDFNWYIGRVAILKDYRGRNGGSFLLNEIEKIARKENVTSLTLGAQCQATPFYKKNGFTPFGEEYIEADIQHIMMEKKL